MQGFVFQEQEGPEGRSSNTKKADKKMNIQKKVEKIHELLKKRLKEVKKSKDAGLHAVFFMKLNHYKAAFEGRLPLNIHLSSWENSTNPDEKQIYQLLKEICDSLPEEAPKPFSIAGCATCGSIPKDSAWRLIQ